MATSIEISEELKSRVQNLARTRQRSPHWIMRQAIQEYIDREEAREDFRQQALDSWQHYQETGSHITGKEARDWLATWGTEDEGEPPPCHN